MIRPTTSTPSTGPTVSGHPGSAPAQSVATPAAGSSQVPQRTLVVGAAATSATRQQLRLPPPIMPSFPGGATPELHGAVTAVMHALHHLLPPGGHRIEVSAVPSAQLDGDEGETHFMAPRRGVQIFIAQDRPGPPETADQRTARYALTFAHELYLHARPFLTGMDAAVNGQPVPRPTTADEEHLSMLVPADDTNGYLRAARAVLSELPTDALRQAFDRQYRSDVRFELNSRGTGGAAHQAVALWQANLDQDLN